MTVVPLTAAPIRTTRTLLAFGVAAGPLWAAVALTQAFTRDGYDITRHPLSMLSNGALGWLQVTNFVLAGLLTIGGAIGLGRTLSSTWAPRLIALNGLGMLCAGVFTMDPADGFPVGTPAGPGVLTWHSFAHFASGSVAFIALIAACYVLSRHYARSGDRARSVASAVAGTALLIGNLWPMTGGPAGSLVLAVGAITAMLWISVVCATKLT
ncbi:DUF998 domain-containing protein [Paractinoplanes toevensis]|uniref:DUF998 domain-containing protein n=1 Tax=Paractinoplanes toevensis TaxID=571911 RepID=A0A919VZT7_9ACTN|nr:DUF998 domain-containing protein [Actinoplanes toevensis]GIM88444.1 hypothetical protein Ato02nite_002370 [Actinoplanes toevensis]